MLSVSCIVMPLPLHLYVCAYVHVCALCAAYLPEVDLALEGQRIPDVPVRQRLGRLRDKTPVSVWHSRWRPELDSLTVSTFKNFIAFARYSGSSFATELHTGLGMPSLPRLQPPRASPRFSSSASTTGKRLSFWIAVHRAVAQAWALGSWWLKLSATPQVMNGPISVSAHARPHNSSGG